MTFSTGLYWDCGGEKGIMVVVRGKTYIITTAIGIVLLLMGAGAFIMFGFRPRVEVPPTVEAPPTAVDCMGGDDYWDYKGLSWPFQDHRDHDVIFNEQDVPVPEGTVVWTYLDWSGEAGNFDLTLSGENADLFKVEYIFEQLTTYGEWRGTPGSPGFELAIWYKNPRGEDIALISGQRITTTEELSEGEYRFTLPGEYRGICEDQRFRVIVDEDRLTVPPAPTNIRVDRDDEGWTITWDPIEGVDRYYIVAYRLNEDGEEVRYGFADEDTWDPEYHVGSYFRGYIEILPHGDGVVYFRAFGKKSERIELR